jgi:hypothetical protein
MTKRALLRLTVLSALVGGLAWKYCWSPSLIKPVPIPNHEREYVPPVVQQTVDLVPRFESVTLQAGEMHQPLLKQNIVLRNKTGRTMHIARIGKSCSCQEIDIDKKSISADDICVLRMTLEIVSKNPGRLRSIREYVAIHTAEREHPYVIIIEAGYVPPMYSLTDAVQVKRVDGLEANSYQGEFSIFCNRARNIEIENISVEPMPGLSARVVERSRVAAEDGTFEKRNYAICIQGDAGADISACTIVCRTNDRETKETRIPVVFPQSNRAPPASVTPTRIAFGTLARSQKVETRKVVIRSSSDSSIRIIAVQPSHGAIEVEVGSRTDVIQLRVGLDTDRVQAGDVDERIEMVLDVSGVRVEQVIPVTAFIKDRRD